MVKQEWQDTREQGLCLARSRLEQMGFRVDESNQRGISFYVMRGGQSLPVRVKTTRHDSWLFTADSLMDITISDDGVQTVIGKKKHPDSDLICILVTVDSEEFYILRLGQLHDAVCTRYENWLEEHEGRRPRKPESMHCAIEPMYLAAYQDNWPLLDEALGTPRHPIG